MHSQVELTQNHKEIKVNPSIEREIRSVDEDGAGSPCYLEDINGDMDLNRPQVSNVHSTRYM